MYRDYFMTRRGQPRLWNCAVLFLDVLGVRAKAMDKRRAGAHLRDLDQALRGSMRDFLDPRSPWPAAFFSDSLVVAAPIVEGDPDGESALDGLILQTAWLQWDLTIRGFFVRGAIAVGKLHLYEGLLFGPALVEAYDLESTRAVHPRVLLARNAVELMDDTLRHYAQPVRAPHNWELLRDDDGEVFVDYLAVGITEMAIDQADVARHRDLIAQRLAESRRSGRVWEKYHWAADYHNAVCRRFWQSQSALCLPQAAASRAFATYV